MNYRKPLPPISELALIASNIQTAATAADKVKMAVAIWDEAQKTLEHHSTVQGKAQAESIRNHEAQIIAYDMHDGITLGDFLKRLFPNSKAVDRSKWHRDFVRAELSYQREGLTVAQIEKRLPEIIADERANGISDPNQCAARFLRFMERSTAAARKNKALTAAKAKKRTLTKKNVRNAKKDLENASSTSKRAPSTKKSAPSKS